MVTAVFFPDEIFSLASVLAMLTWVQFAIYLSIYLSIYNIYIYMYTNILLNYDQDIQAKRFGFVSIIWVWFTIQKIIKY